MKPVFRVLGPSLPRLKEGSFNLFVEDMYLFALRVDFRLVIKSEVLLFVLVGHDDQRAYIKRGNI